MIYKDIGKPPYMQIAPDNSGLYYDLLKIAVERIGFRLEVVRGPKKRTYAMLERGQADMYPSGVFREYRSQFLFFIPNGLHRIEKYYGLTSLSYPEIKSISELKKHNLFWLVELGSSQPGKAKALGVKYIAIKDARIDKAIKLITLDRLFFFRITQEDLQVFKKQKSITSMPEIGIRVHKNCCKTLSAPLYTGFSRRSPYYEEQPNPLYDENKPIGAENFPFGLSPGSVPDKLRKVLRGMIDSGEIDVLKCKYSLTD